MAMQRNSFATDLCLGLALLDQAVPVQAFCQALHCKEREIHKVLTVLEKQGLVRQTRQQHFWEAVSDKAKQKLAELALEKDSGEAGEPLGLALRLLQQKDLLQGGEQMFQVMQALLHAGASSGALLCLDILLHQLRGWDYVRRSQEENNRYLQTVYGIFGYCLYMATRLKAADILLPTALAVASALGDRRMSLQLRLMRVSHLYLVSGHTAEDPQPEMLDVLEGIQEMGDPDILASTAYARGLHFYIQGDFKEAVACLWDDVLEQNEAKFDFFAGLGLQAFAEPACCLGRFDLALGRMVCILNQLRISGAKFALRRTRIQAADLLLRAGFAEEALEMMSDAFSSCDPAVESKIAVSGYRNLAFYQFQQGNYPASYQLLRKAIELGRRYHMERPFLGFSESYELLWAYKEHGLPDLPQNYNLEWILNYSLGSNNQQWQGIALRIRAKELLAKGGRREAAVNLLQDSLQSLQSVGNPLEIARTQLLLSENLRALRREGEAAELYRQARATLEEFRQHDCPPPARRVEKVYAAPPADTCLRRCTEFLSGVGTWALFAEHMQHLADSLVEALRVERVAVYAFNMKGHFDFLAARHFSREERESREFKAHFKFMAECLRDKRCLVKRSVQGVFLYLPVPVQGGQDCVFMLHCAYLTAHISQQTPECFQGLQQLLESELQLAFRLRRGLEVKRCEEERRARLAAERLNEDDRLYYGPSMRHVLLQADKAAATDASVLLLGETGVGKEELARRIHGISGRTGAFVAVNPSSIPETLFESELFGHEKGAFTGAHQQKLGLIELADKGTLFIDEVGDIPVSLQVKLLRVLQSKSFLRVGGTREIHSDFRLISATNQDLTKLVKEKGFREDLYYRMAVVPLQVPPLRDRPEDIKRLAIKFYEDFALRYQKSLPALSPEELADICAHSWPGNVRELKSFIERAVILHDGSLHRVLPDRQRPDAHAEADLPALAEIKTNELAPDAELFAQLPSMQEVQRRYIQYVLEATKGRVDGPGGAREILGMKRSTLYARIREYGLDKASLLYGRDSRR